MNGTSGLELRLKLPILSDSARVDMIYTPSDQGLALYMFMYIALFFDQERFLCVFAD